MTPEELSAEIQTRSAFVAPLRQEIARVLIGQTHLVERMLVCLLTGNHLLVEGLPGLATVSYTHLTLPTTPYV